jgi:hypothetical protein
MQRSVAVIKTIDIYSQDPIYCLIKIFGTLSTLERIFHLFSMALFQDLPRRK